MDNLKDIDILELKDVIDLEAQKFDKLGDKSVSDDEVEDYLFDCMDVIVWQSVYFEMARDIEIKIDHNTENGDLIFLRILLRDDLIIGNYHEAFASKKLSSAAALKVRRHILNHSAVAAGLYWAREDMNDKEGLK